ncbi:MAG: hypothetical protein KAV87_45330 [Desulfobacteraceae bacterium]|nr:hypothetical protein [Desulfobacteraceae bacterium]
MVKTPFRIMAVAVTLGVLAACATIMKGPNHMMTVSSTPSQATVVVQRAGVMGPGLQIFSGPTPATVKLPKNEEYVVTISLAGYKEVQIPVIKDGVEPYFWGNILCGGIPGGVVDLITGAMYKMVPESINVTLERGVLPGSTETQLYVAFRISDDKGDVRAFAVPMIQNVNTH